VLCGQHSLEVFCAGVFLSFTAYFVLVEFSNRVFMQVLVSFLGILLMVVLAASMTWYRGIERRAAPVAGSAVE
jgi:divalent metal cation (Fe/Co/Zn/Cd) transporter